MTKRKKKKSLINEDLRWIEHKKLKDQNKIFEANKLKQEILNSYKYKKPCHHFEDKTK